MKHLIFLLALLLCLAHGSAQYYEEKILLSAGVNMISNPNADNIRPAIGEVDFKSPFSPPWNSNHTGFSVWKVSF